MLTRSSLSTTTTAAKAPAPARGYLAHKRPAWEPADLAAAHYEQRLPIERPSLPTVAAAFRVTVASVKRVRKGKPVPPTPPSLAEHLARSSPAERIEAARALGVDAVWDTMVLPLVSSTAE
jgi:hypothetical protein